MKEFGGYRDEPAEGTMLMGHFTSNKAPHKRVQNKKRV
jgi:hypothetical protein